MAHENTVTITGQPIQPFRPFTNGAAPATDPTLAGQQQLPGPQPAQRKPLINFKENPLSAIGFLLQETARGIEGKPSGVPALKAANAKREALALKRIELGYKTLDEMRKFIEAVDDPELQRKFADTLNKTKAIDLDLNVFVDDPTDAAAKIKAVLDKHPSVFFGMSAREVVDTKNDPQKDKVLQEQSNNRSIGQATTKLVDFVQNIEQRTTPEQKQRIAAAMPDGVVTMSVLTQLADIIGFEPYELAAMRAKQDTVFPQLSEATGIEFKSGGALQKRAEDKPISQIKDEETAKAEVKEQFAKAQTKVGQIRQDVERGHITKAEGEKLLAKEDEDSGGFSITLADGTEIRLGGGQAGRRAIKIEDRRVQAIQTVAASVDLISALEAAGDKAIGAVGAVTRLFDTVSRQGKALAEVFGEDLADFVDFIPDNSPLANESAAIKSQVVSIVYSLITMKQGTRPSDKDMDNAMKLVAAGSGSSGQMAAAINQVMRDTMRDFAIDFRERSKTDFNWAAALKRNFIELPEVGRSGGGQSGGAKVFTLEEVEKMGRE